MQDMWLPQTYNRRVRPTERKHEGGSFFDDELETQASQDELVRIEMMRLIDHLNSRPDHTIYVGSSVERGKLREVLNSWQKNRTIGSHHFTIRLDYGLTEGSIRVGE